MDKPTLNRVRCRKCDDIITSTHRNDFVTCKCNSIATDGGNDYVRLTGDLEDMDLSLMEYEQGEIDMRDYLENIKEDLELFSDEGLTITVSRKDLENLVSAHENLLKGKVIKKENEFGR